MINWDEFEHIHVIRKLKEVISRWWSIDVFFADDRGNLKIIEKGTKREYANHVLNLLLQRDEGYESLSEFVRNTVTICERRRKKISFGNVCRTSELFVSRSSSITSSWAE